MTAVKWKQVACVECPGLKQEITRLRAEVKRLTLQGGMYRDEWGVYMQTKRERDEALAQVAVLLREIYDWPHHEQTSEQASSVLKRLTAAARNLPTEAHALLDRLQRAEAVVRDFQAISKVVMECDLTTDDAYALLKVLQRKDSVKAAWEEGKA